MRGNFELWLRFVSQPRVAIVGTRKASADAILWAECCATELSRQGVCVVSGGALGIDAAAHRGALLGGCKTLALPTIAVLGTSIDKIYPPQNVDVLRRIECSSFLLSESGPGAPNHRSGFLLRNRLIAALSDVVVVVQAPYESGALSTLAYANGLGLKTAIVPWNAAEELARGSNTMLGHRAVAVLDASDVLRLLGAQSEQGVFATASAPGRSRKAKKNSRSAKTEAPPHQSLDLGLGSSFSEIEQKVLAQLRRGAACAEELCLALEVSSRELAVALTGLEIAEQIRPYAGRWVIR